MSPQPEVKSHIAVGIGAVKLEPVSGLIRVMGAGIDTIVRKRDIIPSQHAYTAIDITGKLKVLSEYSPCYRKD
jgi:hypothetical protein